MAGVPKRSKAGYNPSHPHPVAITGEELITAVAGRGTIMVLFSRAFSEMKWIGMQVASASGSSKMSHLREKLPDIVGGDLPLVVVGTEFLEILSA